MTQNLKTESRHILLVAPNPLGDTVMATPTFRALRKRFPEARLALLRRPALAGLVEPSSWFDEVLDTGALLATVRRLRREGFDLAVLFPNSFRSALMVRLGGTRRVLGYNRDGRGLLLSDRLEPEREEGRFVPEPMIDYYLGLAEYLGADISDRRMELTIKDEDRDGADALLTRVALAGRRALVLMSPGASFGPSKCWPPGHFAQAADLLAEQTGVAIAVLAAPGEASLAQAIQSAAAHDVVSLSHEKLSMGLLKAVIARADLLITNDTGPRHVAAALGVPVLTLFGPTDPRWAQIDYAKEDILRLDVECGPCQLPVCPGDHRCMRDITPEQVAHTAADMLAEYARPEGAD